MAEAVSAFLRGDNMWLIFAAASALFAGLTSIFAKCGIRQTDSTVATAIRTVVVLLFAWLMVFIKGSQSGIDSLSGKTWLFLFLSGMATGASWLCYFKALQLGDVNKVVPIDKSSTVLTILLAALLLAEPLSLSSIAAVIFIGAGTLLMIEHKAATARADGNAWLLYAVLSAVFAALTSIFGKIGIENVESNLGTAIRTVIVLFMAWLMVWAEGKTDKLRCVPRSELFYIIISGFATGASWLCYYRALQDGLTGVVVAVDKLSIIVSVAFAYFVFGERLSAKAAAGLFLIVAGTLILALPVLGF